jgi:hypothetical protein
MLLIRNPKSAFRNVEELKPIGLYARIVEI